MGDVLVELEEWLRINMTKLLVYIVYIL